MPRFNVWQARRDLPSVIQSEITQASVAGDMFLRLIFLPWVIFCAISTQFDCDYETCVCALYAVAVQHAPSHADTCCKIGFRTTEATKQDLQCTAHCIAGYVVHYYRPIEGLYRPPYSLAWLISGKTNKFMKSAQKIYFVVQRKIIWPIILRI